MSSLNRRRFVNQSVAAGAVAGTLAVNSAKAYGANDKVVVAVMGLSRGASLARQFATQKNVEIKYVCDVDNTRAASCARLVQGITGTAPQAIGNFRKILNDKSVDALICAAPNHWHAPATIYACDAGKHVYVEKPCSHNANEGELMVKAARKHKRAVQMGSQRRSGAAYQEGIKRLQEGVIGHVYSARAFYAGLRGATGTQKKASVPKHINYDLWQGPAPRTPYTTNRVHYKWHWFWHWGNGELGNNGVHSLDICRWGLGVDYPIHVSSSGGRFAFKDDQQTPDTHTVSFEFKERKSITWICHSCNRHVDGSGFVTFYGDNGTMDFLGDGSYKIYDRRRSKVLETKKGSRGDTEHIVDFLTAIRTDQPLKLNAEILEGHKSTLLCHLGNIAQRTKRALTCSSKDGRILGDDKAMKLWARDYESGWEPKV